MLHLSLNLDKTEIVNILQNHVKKFISPNSSVTTELVGKQKSGVTATITIHTEDISEDIAGFKDIKLGSAEASPKEEKPVEETPKPKEVKTDLNTLVDEPEEEPKEDLTKTTIFG